MSFLKNDTVQRAVRTFVQAAAAILVLTDEPTRTSALVAAGAAGISAVWNALVAPALDSLKNRE
jgi:hypothetical protein